MQQLWQLHVVFPVVPGEICMCLETGPGVGGDEETGRCGMSGGWSMTTKTGMSKEWTVDGEDGRVDLWEVERTGSWRRNWKKKLRKEIRAELFCHCASSSTKFSGTKMSFSPGGDRLNCSVAPPRGQWRDRLQRQQVLKTSSKNRAGWLYWYLFWVVFFFLLSLETLHGSHSKV